MGTGLRLRDRLGVGTSTPSGQMRQGDHNGDHHDALHRNLQELRSKLPAERTAAARRIRLYAEEEANARQHRDETGNQTFTNVIDVFLSHIQSWGAPGSDAQDKRACLVLMNELIDVAALQDSERLVIRFANQLNQMINHLGSPSSADIEMINQTALTLGHLARTASATLTAVFVEFEVKRALEWLRLEQQESRRHAAVFVLREISRNAPTLFSVHVSSFFDVIWIALSDVKPSVRECAALALRYTIQLVARRSSRQILHYFQAMYKHAREEFPECGQPWATLLQQHNRDITPSANSPTSQQAESSAIHAISSKSSSSLPRPRTFSPSNAANSARAKMLSVRSHSSLQGTSASAAAAAEQEGSKSARKHERIRKGHHGAWNVPGIHGALLTFHELLDGCTGNFMGAYFHDVLNDCVLRKEVKMHKDEQVREMVMAILPRIASFCPSEILPDFVDTCVLHVMDAIRPPTPTFAGVDRAAAFRALGNLAAVPQIGEHFRPHIPTTLELIKHALTLPAARSGKHPFFIDALACMSNMTHAQGIPHSLDAHYSVLLPMTFNGGFSEQLIITLSTIGRCAPVHVPKIRKLLLLHITAVLGNGGPPLPGGSGGGSNGNGSSQSPGSLAGGGSGSSSRGPRHGSSTGEKVISRIFTGLSMPFQRARARTSSTSSSYSVAPPAPTSTESESFVTQLATEPSKPYRAKSSAARTRNASVSSNVSGSGVALDYYNPDSATQQLALHTLGSFDFGEISLFPTLSTCVVKFLESSFVTIRREAAVTCCRLLIREQQPERRHQQDHIDFVIERLVLVAMTDEEAEIRCRIILELQACFPLYLTRGPDNLRSLFVLVNDNSFQVRAAAIQSLGRLAGLAPAYIMPSLRTVLMRLLSELNFAVDPRQDQESVVLLALLVQGLDPSLARPHIRTMLGTLLPRLSDDNPRVVSAVMAALGEIAPVAGESLSPYVEVIFAAAVAMMSDRSADASSKHKVALSTIAQVASNTVMSVWPYFFHRRLLGQILQVLTTTTTAWELRQQAMVTLGVLGALDPWLHKMNKKAIEHGDEGLVALEGYHMPSGTAIHRAKFFGNDDVGSDSEVDDDEDEDFLEPLPASAGMGSKKEVGAGGNNTGVLAGGGGLDTGVSLGVGVVNDTASEDWIQRDLDVVAQRNLIMFASSGDFVNANGNGSFAGSINGGTVGGGSGVLLMGSAKNARISMDMDGDAGGDGGDGGGNRLRRRSRRSSVRTLVDITTGSTTTTAGATAAPVPSTSRRTSLNLVEEGGGGGGGGGGGRPGAGAVAAAALTAVGAVRAAVGPKHEHKHATRRNSTSKGGTSVGVATNIQTSRRRGGSVGDPAGATITGGGGNAGGGANKRMNAPIILRDAETKEPLFEGMLDLQHNGLPVPSSILPSMMKDPKEFFPTVAIVALVDVLSDPSLAVHHKSVMDSIVIIFKGLDLFRCVRFLAIIIPHLVHVIEEHAESSDCVALFAALEKIIAIVTGHVSPYLPSIFLMLEPFWNTNLVPQVLSLVYKLATKLTHAQLRIFVPELLPDLLYILKTDVDAESTAMTNRGGGGGGGKAGSVGNKSKTNSEVVLDVLVALGPALSDSMYLVLPRLMGLIERSMTTYGAVPFAVRTRALTTLLSLIKSCNVSDHASTIVHPLVHVLQDCRLDKMDAQSQRLLFEVVMQNFVCLIYRLEEEFAPWALIINKALRSHLDSYSYKTAFMLNHRPSAKEVEQSEHYYSLVQRVLRGQALPKPPWYQHHLQPGSRKLQAHGNDKNTTWLNYDNAGGPGAMLLALPDKFSKAGAEDVGYSKRGHTKGARNAFGWGSGVPAMRPEDLAAMGSHSAASKRTKTDVRALKKAWDTSQRSTEEDWIEWSRRLNLEVLNQSPWPALKACAALAQIHEPLARQLFNAAFVSCWKVLNAQQRDHLVDSLEIAIASPNIPADLLQVLLNLAEFMEHDAMPMPIDIRTLSVIALRCHAFSKALHYKEIEFRTSPQTCIAELISINNNLEHPEAAYGVVSFARKHLSTIELQPSWYERLGQWQEALTAYESKAQQMLARPHGKLSRVASDGMAFTMSSRQVSSDVEQTDLGYNDSSRASSSAGQRTRSRSGSTGLAFDRTLLTSSSTPHDQKDPHNLLSDEVIEVTLGQLRCQQALGEWQAMAKLGKAKWSEILEIEAARQAGAYRQRRQSRGASKSDGDTDNSGGGGGASGSDATPSPGPGSSGSSVESSARLRQLINHGLNTENGLPARLRFTAFNPPHREHASSSVSASSSHSRNLSGILGLAPQGVMNVLGGGSSSGHTSFGFGNSSSFADAFGVAGSGSGGIGGGGYDHFSQHNATDDEEEDMFGGPRSVLQRENVGMPFHSKHSFVAMTGMEYGSYRGNPGGIGSAVSSGNALAAAASAQAAMAALPNPSRSDILHGYAQKVATLSAYSAWALGQWADMARYTSVTSPARIEGSFLRAILSIHYNAFDDARVHIERTYRIVDTSVSALAAESYNRAYNRVVVVQQLAEMQEIITHKELLHNKSIREATDFFHRMRRLWKQRLQGVQQSVEVLLPILAVRSMVMAPHEDLDTWLNFVRVCRRKGRLQLSLKALLNLGIGSTPPPSSPTSTSSSSYKITSLLNRKTSGMYSSIQQANMKPRSRSSFQLPLQGAAGKRSSAAPPFVAQHASAASSATVSLLPRAKLPEGHQTHPRVAFEYLKHLWAIGARREALGRLELLTSELVASLEDDGIALPAVLLKHGGSGEYQQSSSSYSRKSLIIHGRDNNNNTSSNGGGTVLMSSRRRKSSLLFGQMEGVLGLPPLDNNNNNNNNNSNNNLLPEPLGAQPVKSLSGVGLGGIAESGGDDGYDSDSDGPFSGMPKKPKQQPLGTSRTSLSSNKHKKSKPSANRIALLAVSWQQRKRLAVRCYLKLGEWLMALGGTADDTSNNVRFEPMTPRFGANHPDAQGLEQTMGKVLEYYDIAVQLDSGSYTAWHWWALSSFRAYEYYCRKQQHVKANATAAAVAQAALGSGGGGGVNVKKKPTMGGRKQFVLPGSAMGSLDVNSSNGIDIASLGNHKKNKTVISNTPQTLAMQAIKGFFRSIALGRREGVNVLQDILRLLALWFSNTQNTDILDTIRTGLSTVAIDTWLDVIPQLIARVSQPGDLVSELLNRVGREHPQVLIYPLTVASKSDRVERAEAAHAVMATMRETNGALVDEAQVVSRELIRVAVLWPEMWHKGLDEASSLYFTKNRNIDAMIAVLLPLHQMMENGPETLQEVGFMHAHGRPLMEASEWLRVYQTTPGNKSAFLNQAWELYYGVYQQIAKQLDSKKLELRHVSPRLLNVRDLQLAMPGTYQAGKPVISIVKIEPSLRVISSKQRPRVVTLLGSDGQKYMFLLKGNEDLRLDERVMQLFGLVNTLLSTDAETNRQELNIRRYAVIPLSDKAGLIEWVPNTDTLNELVREYRESRGVVHTVETHLILKMAPNFENLKKLQKLEVFEYALGETSGQDISKVMWLKSPNSEVWLDRRTNYTRSLACMSMVGYILGLGDRHPSNLMLERSTGRVLHIDFGDCFEVAMQRDRFPEKIPFRLTRMLVTAMEASGIEGNFRFTCESVMGVLRQNRESVMTMLEAFVYDPLITWRLLQYNLPSSASDGSTGGGDAVAKAKAKATAERIESGIANLDSNESGNVIQAATDEPPPSEMLNERAVEVIERVRAKLRGADFNVTTTNITGIANESNNNNNNNNTLDIPSQVKRLIQEATSHENLCQTYLGWSPCW